MLQKLKYLAIGLALGMIPGTYVGYELAKPKEAIIFSILNNADDIGDLVIENRVGGRTGLIGNGASRFISTEVYTKIKYPDSATDPTETINLEEDLRHVESRANMAGFPYWNPRGKL